MANEKRLIDAVKLVIKLAKKVRFGRIEYDDVLAVIADAPTVDAVEVVRCKDCKKSIKCSPGIICSRSNGLIGITENDFCSYGERR